MSDALPDPSDAENPLPGASTPEAATKKAPVKKPTVAKKPVTKASTSKRPTAAKRPVAAKATATKKPAVRKPAVRKAPAKTAPRAADAKKGQAATTAAPAAAPVPPIVEGIDLAALTIASTYDLVDHPGQTARARTEPAAVVDPAEEAPTIEEAGPAASGDRPDALVARGLIKRFGGFTALAGIDLTVPAGSFYGIVGPNGAGKTTTLSILSGFLKADAGTVQISGVDQAEDPKGVKAIMGILPDRLRTFDRLTARQLLRYYGLLRGLSADVIDKRTADLARAFDLTSSLGRVVSDFSAGMTKKLMLAGAMIHSPRVLVLDEPFESVDPVASGIILDILRAYVDHGGTVILSSHGMDLVERVCSRIAVIVGGELLAEGTVEEISAGQSLEARFMELAGGVGEVEGLEWLHTFSD